MAELKKYDKSLFAKPRWLVLNKTDLIPDGAARAQKVADFVRRLRWKGRVFTISAISGEGCRKLCQEIGEYLAEQRQQTQQQEQEQQA